ncbi:hypothetical protein SAY87_026729 [Trapa incisa]|uniref:WRC domain-containing protein n=1 Tax=Trapa incisa TaxID=236973 RepID=A0AAN7GZV4_9MYRT|nr:hypothetical protein SAY87_026729 [Trapa incisa]
MLFRVIDYYLRWPLSDLRRGSGSHEDQEEKGQAPALVALPGSPLITVPLRSLQLRLRWYLVPPVQLVLRSATTDDIGNNSKPPSDQDASNRTPISLHKTVDQDSADLGVKFIGDKKLITSDGSSISTPGRIDAKVQLSNILSRGGKKPRRNQEDSEEEEGEDGEVEGEEEDNLGTADSKNRSIAWPSNPSGKRGRGARCIVMGGSGCSRVNGRGWRCGQPTLVGYCLCEHHLGKGRLRSMITVRNRRQHRPENAPPLSVPPRGVRELKHEEDEDYMCEEKNNKKEVVKARSMSSLLGQDAINGDNTISGRAAPLKPINDVKE